MSQYFLRDEGKQALDGAAFHYSIYRSLSRTLGMDGASIEARRGGSIRRC